MLGINFLPARDKAKILSLMQQVSEFIEVQKGTQQVKGKVDNKCSLICAVRVLSSKFDVRIMLSMFPNSLEYKSNATTLELRRELWGQGWYRGDEKPAGRVGRSEWLGTRDRR